MALTFVLGPSLVLPSCLGIKTCRNLYYYIKLGKEIFFDSASFGIHGLTCIDLARKRQICKPRRVVYY